ncbi:MAG: NADH-quinone oxidoreductase subunit C, partial [Calditrichia bacterium]
MIENSIIKTEISKKFPEATFEEFRGMLSVIIDQKKILDLMRFLDGHPQFPFDYLTDITAVDYLKQDREPRFDLVYHLYTFKQNQRLRVKLKVNEEEMEIDSVSGIWKAALWLEREVFEMFGFNFAGHPDLRRLLLPDVFD